MHRSSPRIKLCSALFYLCACSTVDALHPNNQASYTYYSGALHDHLLSSYNRMAPPRSERVAGSNSEAGTDVYVQMRFVKIESVAAADGRMRVRVWFRLKWKDLRLKWEPNDWGGITQTHFNGAGNTDAELSEIWLPDVTMMNSADSFAAALEPAYAVAISDGTIFWSRPGTIDIMCRFSGLSMFPYDSLSCPLEIGGWINGGSIQGVLPYPEGCASLTKTEETSLASYQQYDISAVECHDVVYTYPCCPDETYPMLNYRIFLSRAESFYDLMIMFPSIIFTVLSFAVFFMSFQVGERLGFGVTLALTGEVSKTAVSPNIPMCGELLWIELFFTTNLIFTMLALLESCVVLGIAYNTEDYILPPFLNPFSDKYIVYSVARSLGLRGGRRGTARVGSSSSAGGDGGGGSGSTCSSRHYEPAVGAHSSAGNDAEGDESSAATKMRSLMAGKGSQGSLRRQPTKMLATMRADNKDEVASVANRLLFFEHLFFRLDHDGSGTIPNDDIRRVLIYTALDMTAADIDQAIERADSEKRDGKLNRAEFVDLCIELLWGVPVDQLDSAATNYADSQQALINRRSVKWRRIANEIDRHCRFWFFFCYCVALGLLYCLRLEDRYAQKVLTTTNATDVTLMSQLWLAMSVSVRIELFVVVLVVVALILGIFCCHHIGARRMRKAALSRGAAVGQESVRASRARDLIAVDGGGLDAPDSPAVRGDRMPQRPGAGSR